MAKLRPFICYWLPVLVWMFVIFSASGDRMSMEHSSRIIGPIVRWLFPHFSEQRVEQGVLIGRKCAHLAEYAVLAVLIWRAFCNLAAGKPGSWQRSPALRTVLLVALYSATDEFHQGFVPTRNGSVQDVLLDTTGAAIALFFLWACGRWRERRQPRRDLP